MDIYIVMVLIYNNSVVKRKCMRDMVRGISFIPLKSFNCHR